MVRCRDAKHSVIKALAEPAQACVIGRMQVAEQKFQYSVLSRAGVTLPAPSSKRFPNCARASGRRPAGCPVNAWLQVQHR